MINPGDELIAINPKSKYLTNGKIYIVIHYRIRKCAYEVYKYVYVRDDIGRIRRYGIKSFVPKSQRKEEQK